MSLCNDFVIIQKIIELLHYGVEDIQMNSYYSKKSNKVISKMSDGVVDCLISFDDDCKDVFGTPFYRYWIRNGSSIHIQSYVDSDTDTSKYECIFVNKDSLCKILQFIFEKKLSSLDGINIQYKCPHVIDDYNNYTVPTESAITPAQEGLSTANVKDNLVAMLYLCDYPTQLCNEILNVECESIRGIKTIDNRAWIEIPSYVKTYLKLPFDWNYIVISKNPYDYFFCSYGNAFQSCFSLNSEHQGFYGMVPFSKDEGHYIMYISNGEPHKCSLIDGSKWFIPKMYLRTWLWEADNGALLIDKPYTIDSYKDLWNSIIHSSFITKIFGEQDRQNPITLSHSEDIYNTFREYSCCFYADSIRFNGIDETTIFQYNAGTKEFIGSSRMSRKLSVKLKDVKSIGKDININKPIKLVFGQLNNFKLCPITGLYISEGQEKHEYAKYFKEPVKKLCCLTYVDGFFKMDNLSDDCDLSCINPNARYDSTTDTWTRYFSLNHTPLNTLKALLNKLNANIILRVINGGQVTFIKYKAKKDA